MYSYVLRVSPRTGEMARLVKCLPYKPEDLSSDPQKRRRNLGLAVKHL